MVVKLSLLEGDSENSENVTLLNNTHYTVYSKTITSYVYTVVWNMII